MPKSGHSRLGRPRITNKVNENRDKYLDLVRELKKPCHMKVTATSFAVRALGTNSKELLKELEDLEIRGQVETIQTTALLSSARILRKVLNT